MVAQIFKWFQNNERAEKVCITLNPTKKLKKSSVIDLDDDDNDNDDDDDECSHSENMKELTKELKKKKIDDDKTCRLLSLTFKRRRDMRVKGSSAGRISSVLEEYPCFGDPRFVSIMVRG